MFLHLILLLQPSQITRESGPVINSAANPVHLLWYPKSNIIMNNNGLRSNYRYRLSYEPKGAFFLFNRNHSWWLLMVWRSVQLDIVQRNYWELNLKFEILLLSLLLEYFMLNRLSQSLLSYSSTYTEGCLSFSLTNLKRVFIF